MEQYKLYVEIADRISQRRLNTVPAYFASVNAILLSLYGLWASLKGVALLNRGGLLLICFAGILLSVAWKGIASNFRELATAKFKVIHQF
jgi:hypothetical protein